MNTKIVIYQELWPFTGATLALALEHEGVTVKFDDPVLIPWDKALDATYLSQQFRGVRVYEFEALCKGLGEAWKMKDMLPPKTTQELYGNIVLESGGPWPPSVPALDAVFASQRQHLDGQ